jgi:hypothetical protein
MLTIKYVNHPDGGAVNGIPSKGKIHPQIAKKGLMVRQVLKTKKPRRTSAAWWENSLLRHGAVELLRVRRRTVVNVNVRLRLEGDVCQRRPICAMKTEPRTPVKGLIVI